MIICAIESSCDETSISILKINPSSKKIQILSNTISSQIKIHAKWGGVVPNLAAREHLKNIRTVLETSLSEAKTKIQDIDLFAVTQGPGLIPALLIGTNFAKTLSFFWQKPLIGIHHVEGHIYSNFLKNTEKITFPILTLTISGGHTQLILIKNHFQYEIVGQTVDDAAGEAFDKVAKILNLGYPGGPIVSEMADSFFEKIKDLKNKKLKSNLQNIKFPRPMLNSSNLNFSFSGLKTAVLYYWQDLNKKNLSKKELAFYKLAICWAFQEATVDILKIKTLKAIKKYQIKTFFLAGGVSANKKLRETLKESIKKTYPSIYFSKPELILCGDNAAMIGIAAFYRYQNLQKNKKQKSLEKNWKTLQADPNLKINRQS